MFLDRKQFLSRQDCSVFATGIYVLLVEGATRSSSELRNNSGALVMLIFGGHVARFNSQK